MSEQLTPEQIDYLREWLPATARGRGAAIRRDILLRAAAQFLQLHDERERLRNLQAGDVTEEQRTEWLGTAWYFRERPWMHSEMMAAAVRVMLGGEP